MTDRLLMIYNADAGFVNGARDSLHKLFSPASYACRLCDITHGLIGMKRDWRQTIEALPLPVTFLHRDEWQAQYPGNPTPLPAILRETDGTLDPIVAADEFAGITTLPALQALLAARLPPDRNPPRG